MIVTELKTKFMTYGKHDVACSFSFNAKTLQKVEEYKYLGVIFNGIKLVWVRFLNKSGLLFLKRPQRQVFQSHKNVHQLAT